MTHPYLALDSASFLLPDSRLLLSGLTEQFDTRHTGLVGRNGVGKSVLARLLAGELAPSSGRVLRAGRVCYLSQQVEHIGVGTVASLAGVQPVLGALARIDAGSIAEADFELVGDRWDLPARLHHALEQAGLGHIDAATPAARLSGGEAMRVALLGAMLSEADFLILDEPTNHLDAPSRAALGAQLRQWKRGLLVVSHDRALLAQMERIVELSPQGLRSYGGNYAFYTEARALEQGSAVRELDHARQALQREDRAMREQRERQQRRQAQGAREGKSANQARILLGRQKERSENSSGRLRQRHDEARQQQQQRVRDAAQGVREDSTIRLHATAVAAAAQRRVAELEDVELPFAAPPFNRLSLVVTGQMRLGVTGPNGSGKSTLLKVIAGELAPLAGDASRDPACAWLDQGLATLDPQRSTIAQLLEVNRSTGQDRLRTYLAQLGLDAQKVALPAGLLSGGERLKAALACALYADPPARLLLLDEPGNHLDLASNEALEAMLNAYAGALVVVSHDEVFLERIGLTHRLEAGRAGWRLRLL
ncbi:ATP-binding cassette domain-containing protein [Massilia yuzhufengensis]|uniref:ATPase components of ABC transporters with duplicated ATPase domains n=1 Tax=Massilia yuzhufengensis TaxID=1164594 RepID=A0A1I1TV69_9BURK|nr:ATP-binding cassette domain-containing protein [Massilia yuzhufengensis]SFD59450.1 ATPase components of ABC transporters with duplicated ATPase domains [Massilia yuzhufengensis]